MTDLSDSQIDARIRELDKDPGWYQDIKLPGGRQTKTRQVWGEDIDHPRKRFAEVASAVPKDMTGMSVLDVGCNAGYFAFEAADRGADRIVGIDRHPGYIEQARFCSAVRDQTVDFRVMDIYDLPTLEERFDFVFCVGILYHCKFLMRAVQAVSDITRSTLVVETAIHPGNNELPLVRFVRSSEYVGADATGAARLPGHWHPNMTSLKDLFAESGFPSVQELFTDGGRGGIVAQR